MTVFCTLDEGGQGNVAGHQRPCLVDFAILRSSDHAALPIPFPYFIYAIREGFFLFLHIRISYMHAYIANRD